MASMFNFLRTKSVPKAPDILRVPGKEFDAAMGGAMHALTELERIAARAESRLRQYDKPIVQTDLEELLRLLNDASQKIDTERQESIASSTNARDTEWDQSGYNLLVAPTFRTANSPKDIVDQILTAADKGAKSASLLYKLVIAEMNVTVARYYVTMNTGLITE